MLVRRETVVGAGRDEERAALLQRRRGALDFEHSGPFEDDWQTTDTTDVAQLVYAPCGEQRNFNINAELRANAGTSNPQTTTSFISMDSTDGSIKTTYHFAWKTCNS